MCGNFHSLKLNSPVYYLGFGISEYFWTNFSIFFNELLACSVILYAPGLFNIMYVHTKLSTSLKTSNLYSLVWAKLTSNSFLYFWAKLFLGFFKNLMIIFLEFLCCILFLISDYKTCFCKKDFKIWATAPSLVFSDCIELF